jgi:hypothetical protein
MRLPIDTTAMGFIASGPATPKLDYDTGRPKADVNGEPVFVVKVMAMAGGQVEVLTVNVSGEPKGLVSGTQVRLVGLSALPYEMKDRSGVSFNADRVEVIRPDGRSEVKAGS